MRIVFEVSLPQRASGNDIVNSSRRENYTSRVYSEDLSLEGPRYDIHIAHNCYSTRLGYFKLATRRDCKPQPPLFPDPVHFFPSALQLRSIALARETDEITRLKARERTNTGGNVRQSDSAELTERRP